MTHYVGNHQMQQGNRSPPPSKDDAKKVNLKPSAYETEKQDAKEKQPPQQQQR